MHDQHPSVAAIDSQLRDLQIARQGAESDRARAALSALSGDQKAQANAERVEQELAGYVAAIDRLTAARRAAVEQAAGEFASAKAEALKANIADAIGAAKQRADAAVKVEKAIATLGAALEQHNALGILCGEALHKCTHLIGSPEAVRALLDRAHGDMGTVRQALFFALQRVQEVGIPVSVEFPGLSTTQAGIAEKARADLEDIERVTSEWSAA
jgi:multidrug efflux pump subunit AcrA (membrane-fusion protein)